MYEIFLDNFVNPLGNYKLIGYWPRPDDKDQHLFMEKFYEIDNELHKIKSDGNGRIRFC